MKQSDYHSIYERAFNENIKTLSEEIINQYKNSRLEGDAENFAYNSIQKMLYEKELGIQIKDKLFYGILRKFNNRASLVHKDFSNNLYIKHLAPLFNELKIEDKNYTFYKIIEDLAKLEVLRTISSKFNQYYQIYKMMYELNDFEKFEIFLERANIEDTELFKELHQRSYPHLYIIKSRPEVNFEVKKEFKENLGRLYEDLKLDFIDEELTTKKDFINVLTKNSSEHESKIYFSNFDYFSAYILREIEFAFEKLNFTNIGASEIIYKKNEKPFTQSGLSHSLKIYNQNSIQNDYAKFINLKNDINKIIEGLKSIKK